MSQAGTHDDSSKEKTGVTVAPQLSGEEDAGRDTVEMLAEEFAALLRDGKRPSIAAYSARYPQHAQRIRELFPYVGMMEQFQQTASDRLEEESGLDAALLSRRSEVQPNQPILGDYVLLSKIGRGGMGRVFKARHRHLDRLVALKVLPPAIMKQASAVERFHREMKTTAKLFHPNIVTAFDAGEQEGVHYLVVEYVDGRVLSQIVKDHGALSSETAANYALQAARGLLYAHSREVIHRDVKPGNLICGADGCVKVVDFGLARFNSAAALTASGTILGTAYYMSPEQITDASSVDSRTDIYSLGCTLFFLLTGRPPFSGAVTDAIRAHQEQPPPRLKDLRDGVPEQLEAIVQKCLVKQPAGRYPSMGEVVADLEMLEADTAAGAFSNRSAHHLAKTSSVAIGLDVGTSVSLIAQVGSKGDPTTVMDELGEIKMPTVVAIDGHNVTVGSEAFSGIGIPPDNVAHEIKHSSELVRLAAEGVYPREVLFALVLFKLVDRIRRKNREFDRVAIAVPNGFSEVQRKSVMDAAYIAGFDSVDLLNETIAAALFYACQSSRLPSRKALADAGSRDLLVVKLGAGDFATSFIRWSDGALHTLATESRRSLGGQDFDDCLVELVRDRVAKERGVRLAQDRATTWLLRQKCETAKQTLSQHETATIRLDFRGRSVPIKVDRSRFRERSTELRHAIRQSVEGVFKQATPDGKGVDQVLLTGGATRMPFVRGLIKNLAGAQVPIEYLPDDSVAQGAALFAQLQGNRRHGIKPQWDVSVASCGDLGVRVSDRRTGRDANCMLIPRNTPLPASTKSFILRTKDQGSATLRILQNMGPAGGPFESIGNCTIDGFDASKLSDAKLAVHFELSTSGRLAVRAECPSTGRMGAKELTYGCGLSNVELKQWRDWVDTMMLCSGLFGDGMRPAP